MPIPQLNSHYRWSNRRPKNINSKDKRSRRKTIIIKLIKLSLILIVLFALYIVWLTRNLPNPNQLINREVAQSTTIYDRSGEHILYQISGEQKRTLVPLSDIPEYVKQATISIEDKNFYKHGGISVWSIFRTLVTNVLRRQTAGGSTLTQQFIKNAVLTPEKKITRKIKEIILAVRIEKKFSKDQILQMYLNEIPYGSNAYGIEAASQKYFGKSVKEISLPEAATLAAIVQMPTRYSPYGPNKKTLLKRKDYVLDLMLAQGYINADQAETAKKEELKFRPPETNITAPHFVMYIKEKLAEKYGEKTVEQGGLKIYTTLDIDKQKFAEEVINEKTKDYQTKYHASNAALVSIDPKTGQILAMVGSRDYFNDEIDGQVNITTSPRQPGSSMKPLVYATLFEKGYTPSTILYDVKTNFSTDPQNPYQPNNYDGGEHGPISIRQALAGSLNIPAVKALYLAGVNNVIDTAESLGYTTLNDRSRFGLALVLGGAEVNLLEHANAYSAFARDGLISPPIAILKVVDKDGKTLEEYQESKKQVLSSQVVRMINSILSDNSARAFIFGERNHLTVANHPVAAKTGTTNDFKDAWTIGYTPSLVTGVWVGNNDNTSMKKGSDGSVLAAPIWQDFMTKALGSGPAEEFKAPDDYKTDKAILDGELKSGRTILIDKSSGLLASSSTPAEMIETKTIREHHSILYYVDKENPRGPIPNDPQNDPQFNLWENSVIDWAKRNNDYLPSNLPNDYDNLHTPENKPSIKIDSPSDGETITNNNLNINVTTSAPRGVALVEYYINGNLLSSSRQEPFNFSGSINFLNNGYHHLKARACDDVYNCSDVEINLNLLIKNGKAKSLSEANITYPENNKSLSPSDFPLNINVNIKNPEQASKVNILLKHGEEAPQIIASLSSLSENNNFSWSPSPISGQYLLYSEVYDWNAGIRKSRANNLEIK